MPWPPNKDSIVLLSKCAPVYTSTGSAKVLPSTLHTGVSSAQQITGLLHDDFGAGAYAAAVLRRCIYYCSAGSSCRYKSGISVNRAMEGLLLLQRSVFAVALAGQTSAVSRYVFPL